MKKYEDINDGELDALTEIANIGTGNATTALAQLTGKPVKVELPKVTLVPFQKVPELLGGAESIVTAILLEVSGDLQGMFMFLQDLEFSERLLTAMFALTPMELNEELRTSALQEAGNIMCCSYLNAIHSITGFHMMINPPDCCTDMAGALLSIPMIHFAQLEDTMLFMETMIEFDGAESIPCHILFIPELNSLQALMQQLGICAS